MLVQARVCEESDRKECLVVLGKGQFWTQGGLPVPPLPLTCRVPFRLALILSP